MTAGEWYSKPDRPRQTFGHFDTTAIADDETRRALERIRFELEQLNRGCEYPIEGLRADCWSPKVTRPQYGYYMAGFNQLVLSANLRVTSESNRRQIMLPDAVQRPGGQCWVVDYDGDAATNPVTIGTIKGQKINGADTFSINQNYGAVQFTSTGTDWRAVSNSQGGSASPGGGDVGGPGSSTDNSIPSFDGTGGKTLQDPGVAFLSANGLQLHGTEDTVTINGTSYDVHLIVHDEASTDVSLGLHKHSNTGAHAPVMEFARSRGTEDSETVVADGNDLGRISFLGHDGTDYEQAADILVEVDGTPGSDDMPGRIKFRTTQDGANTPTLALTINSEQSFDIQEVTEPSDPGASALRLWAEDNNGFSFLHYKDDSGVARELARDSVHIVRNNTGSTLTAGTVVYINGSTGVVPTVAKAQADSESTLPALGIVAADISTASFGLVVTVGDVSGFDTSGFSAGDVLYVDASTAGTLTATKPSGDGEFIQRVGVVVKSAAGAAGIVAVQPTTVRPVVRTISGGGTGASDADGAADNLISGASAASIGMTNAVLTAIPGVGGSSTGEASMQDIFDLINSLTAETSVDIADVIALYEQTSGATEKATIENLFKGAIATATNDTSPDRNVEFIARDGSGNLRAVLFDDLHPNGQAFIAESYSYTGSGSTGKTVTLTGINRAEMIMLMRNDTTANQPMLAIPSGGTGNQNVQFMGGGLAGALISLSAPAAGSSQVLTINTTNAGANASGVSYRAYAVGSPI